MKWSLSLVFTLCVYEGTNGDGLFGIFDGAKQVLRGGLDGVKGVIGEGGPVHEAAEILKHGANHIADTVLDRSICERDLSLEYRLAIADFNTRLYKSIALHNNDHFVLSSYTMWLSLAALAEGADENNQRQLFQALNLPLEMCARQKYYQLALSAETSGPDVNLLRNRAFFIDRGVTVNPTWETLVRTAGICEINFSPIRSNPLEFSEQLRKANRVSFLPALSSYSFLIDTLDYQALWTTAFADSLVERVPFYDDQGVQCGLVDMMRMRKRVRMAHFPLINAKVLELPVGNDGRYTMIYTIGLEKTSLRHAIDTFLGKMVVEVLATLQMSLIPIDIAIPRFALTSEFDARRYLEEIGVSSIWTDPAATRYVSDPPAVPSGYLHRVSINIGSEGVEPPLRQTDNIISGLVNMVSDTATGLAAAVGHDFIANRPFMYGLYDTKTRTCLFHGAYSRPTYR